MAKTIKRVATKKEVENLYEFIIETMWKDVVNYSSSVFNIDYEQGYDKIRKKNLKYLKNTYNDFIVVDEIKEYDFKLFILSATVIDQAEEQAVFTFYSRYIQKGSSYEIWKDEFDYCNLKEEVKSNAGRPNRPTNDSIIKTYKIKKAQDDGVKIDDACKKEKLAKSTYYRVAKWIRNNVVTNEFSR